MLWGDWFIIAGTALYCGACCAYYAQGMYAHAWTYLCYAGANVGLVMTAHWRGK